MPEVLRPAVERYLSVVSPTARDLLALASLIGAEFEFAVIRIASAVEAEQLLDVLAESEFVGVLQRVDTPGGRYRFVHEFVREALCDSITGATEPGFTAGSQRRSKRFTSAVSKSTSPT